MRDAVRLGVGIYLFEGSAEAESSEVGTLALEGADETAQTGRRRRARGGGRP